MTNPRPHFKAKCANEPGSAVELEAAHASCVDDVGGLKYLRVRCPGYPARGVYLNKKRARKLALALLAFSESPNA